MTFGSGRISGMPGAAQNTDSQYETGKIPWTDEILVKLALFYGVSVDDLLGLTGQGSNYRGKAQKRGPNFCRKGQVPHECAALFQHIYEQR